MGVSPTTRDPLAAWDTATDAVLGNVYRTVLAPPGEDDAGVCDRWTNPGPNLWVLHLRPGLTFQDGTPIRSEDVAASITSAIRRTDWNFQPMLAAVADVDPSDPETVRIRTRSPSSLVPGLREVPVMPRGRPVTTPDGMPVGSGPYRVVRWSTGTIELEHVPPTHRPDEWHRVTFLIAKTSARQLRLLRCCSPSVGFLLDEDVQDAAAREGMRVIPIPCEDEWYLLCNVRPGRPLADPRLRRRLAADLDRGTIARTMGKRFAPATDVFPPGVIGAHPGRFTVDPGWADCVPTPPAPLQMLVLDSVDVFEGNVLGQLRSSGWNVHVRVSSSERFFEDLAAGRFDIVPLGFSFPGHDGMEMLAAAFPSAEGTRAGANFSGYHGTGIGRETHAALSSLDESSRLRHIQEAAEILARDIPWIPLIVSHRDLVSHGPVSVSPRPGGRLRLDRLIPEKDRQRLFPWSHPAAREDEGVHPRGSSS